MGALWAFVGVAALVIVTPGPDTALTVRNALLGGRRAGVATAAGVALGLAVWTAAASAGLAALLVASEPAFVAVKLAGAAYLVLLGAQTLLHALRGARPREAGGRDGGAAAPRGVALRQGLLNDLGNPKIAVFFTTLLPQFAPGPRLRRSRRCSPSACIFCAMTFAWLCAYSAAGRAARATRCAARGCVGRWTP